MVWHIVIIEDNDLSSIYPLISLIQFKTMKTDALQQTQRILNLIAKRDLDDDGKIDLLFIENFHPLFV